MRSGVRDEAVNRGEQAQIRFNENDRSIGIARLKGRKLRPGERGLSHAAGEEGGGVRRRGEQGAEGGEAVPSMAPVERAMRAVLDGNGVVVRALDGEGQL